MKLLQEILNDYPRIWEFYKHNSAGEKTNTPKYTQRYPVPISTLSMIIDFHKWTHATAHLVNETTGIELPNHVRRTEVGPDPVVMFRINWIDINWHAINKSLADTLSGEIVQWHTRIRIKVNDADVYSYQPSVMCSSCNHRSVMRINDEFICVNSACRDIMTGEVRRWQIN